MIERDEDTHALRSLETALLAGLAHAVLFMVARSLLLRAPDPGDPGLSEWYASASNQRSMITAVNLVAIGCIAFLWFVAVIRRRVGLREERFLGTVFLGSALLAAGIRRNDGTGSPEVREDSGMPNLNDLRELLADEHGLAVVSTVQRDGRVLSSVVNAGVMSHPSTGEDMVAFVSGGRAARLAHIRSGSDVTVAVRRGWRWAGATGSATLIGPDDAAPNVDVPALLRDVFRAAGGTHDDWDEYDRVMATDRRTVVFVDPTRIIGNG